MVSFSLGQGDPAKVATCLGFWVFARRAQRPAPLIRREVPQTGERCLSRQGLEELEDADAQLRIEPGPQRLGAVNAQSGPDEPGDQ